MAEVPVFVSRTGYSGELGYELYYARDYASHLWDAVFEAGQEFGAKPAGLGALRTTRMEKKYPLYGLDVSEETSPLEASLGWAVDLDKYDFIGRDALRKQADDGVTRVLVGIGFADTSFMPSTGDPITTPDGASVGRITSAETGWFLGRNLAMGYVDAEIPAGTDVTVGSATGVLTTEAFYDPERVRVRS